MVVSKQERQHQTILQLWNESVYKGTKIHKIINISLFIIYNVKQLAFKLWFSDVTNYYNKLSSSNIIKDIILACPISRITCSWLLT